MAFSLNLSRNKKLFLLAHPEQRFFPSPAAFELTFLCSSVDIDADGSHVNWMKLKTSVDDEGDAQSFLAFHCYIRVNMLNSRDRRGRGLLLHQWETRCRNKSRNGESFSKVSCWMLCFPTETRQLSRESFVVLFRSLSVSTKKSSRSVGSDLASNVHAVRFRALRGLCKSRLCIIREPWRASFKKLF